MLSLAAYFIRMSTQHPIGRSPSVPGDMHVHAMDNIRFIRRTMESAGCFTAVSGSAQVVIGITALGAAVIASRQSTANAWLITWLAEAVLAVGIGAWGIGRKARALGLSLGSGPSRKFAICFAPPLVGGAVLTPVLFKSGNVGLLPGLWLLLFGTAVVTGGALSVRIVPVMGVCFMAVGTVALACSPRWGDLFMAAGFGLLMIVYGFIIARRHGG